MELLTKFVDFKKYCPKCEYEKLKETLDPCNDCLAQGANLNTEKPIHFKEKKQWKKYSIYAMAQIRIAIIAPDVICKVENVGMLQI